MSVEETKEAAMISTNKALERYMHSKGERLKAMYATRKKRLDQNKQKSNKVMPLRDE